MADDSLPFHTLFHQQFQDVANKIIEHKHKITIQSFAFGRDGGRDGAAKYCNIYLNGETRREQFVIVQAKHTSKIETLSNTAADRLLKNEFDKVNSNMYYII